MSHIEFKIEVVLHNGEPANLYAPNAYEAECIAQEFDQAVVMPVMMAW